MPRRRCRRMPATGQTRLHCARGGERGPASTCLNRSCRRRASAGSVDDMTSQPTSVATPPAQAHPQITRGLTLLLAVMGGIAVGNLYWAQPLLHLIADDLH